MGDGKLKVCKYPKCHILTKQTYCDKHKRNNNKYYNDKRKNDDAMKFYRSKEWREKRIEILKRDCFTCVKCGGVANLVHHKTELRVDYTKRLDDDNLESVCKSCHNKIDHQK